MRWLFVLSILLSCWAANASRDTLFVEPAQQTGVREYLSAFSQTDTDSRFLSLNILQADIPHDLRRKSAARYQPVLSRGHLRSASASYSTSAALLDSLVSKIDLRYRFTPQPRKRSIQLISSDWTLHAPRHQSRIGGWKESNILYRSMLTYHS